MRVESDDAAVVDNGNAVAQPLGLFHVVGCVDEGCALGAKSLDHLEDAIAGLRIDAGGGLVHEDKAGLVDEAGSHVEAALHSPGEVSSEIVGAVFEGCPLETPCDGDGEPSAGKTIVATEGAQVFSGRETRIDSQLLRHPSERGTRGKGGGGRTEDVDCAGVRDDTADDGANESAFARAVGAEQAETLPGAKLERDVVDGGDRAESLDESGDEERRGIGWRDGVGCGCDVRTPAVGALGQSYSK
jgi:hypothetical protein